eukprot:gene13680-biopygen5721
MRTACRSSAPPLGGGAGSAPRRPLFGLRRRPRAGARRAAMSGRGGRPERNLDHVEPKDVADLLRGMEAGARCGEWWRGRAAGNGGGGALLLRDGRRRLFGAFRCILGRLAYLGHFGAIGVIVVAAAGEHAGKGWVHFPAGALLCRSALPCRSRLVSVHFVDGVRT